MTEDVKGPSTAGTEAVDPQEAARHEVFSSELLEIQTGVDEEVGQAPWEGELIGKIFS